MKNTAIHSPSFISASTWTRHFSYRCLLHLLLLAYLTWQRCCTLITNDVALVTMVCFSKVHESHVSWYCKQIQHSIYLLLTLKNIFFRRVGISDISFTCPTETFLHSFTAPIFTQVLFNFFYIGSMHLLLLVSPVWPSWIQILLLPLLHLQKHCYQ